uniref:N-acetyltransferase domain-containing protein n=1 Tax=Acrobeloides nanus TaxID=290746 RepID=A0A914DSY3_9BILA
MDNKWIFVPLAERPEYKDECISLLNKEWPRSVVQREASMQRSLNKTPPMSLILLHEEDHKLVGYAKLCTLPNNSDGCWVESVIIQHELRGSGLGRVLMNFIEAKANEFNFNQIFLSTEDKEAFYLKCGYVRCPPVLNFGANAGLFAKRNLGKLMESSNSFDSQHSVPIISSTLNQNLPQPVVPPPPAPPSLPPTLQKSNACESKKLQKVYMCKSI